MVTALDSHATGCEFESNIIFLKQYNQNSNYT